jgi:twinkle protein
VTDVEEYVKSKSWKYKIVNGKRGPFINTNFCPLCKSTSWDHFYIDPERGYYLCHKCGERGSFLTLKEKVGDLMAVAQFKPAEQEEKPTIPMSDVDQAHAALMENGDALRWMHRRRFTLEALEHFKLGYSEEKGNQWIWFPYIVDGVVKDIKKRSLIGKEFIRVGGESVFLNEDVFKENPEEIYVTEGESDCIALWSAGLHNVVGATVGAQGVNPAWIDLLDRIPQIYICYDMDDAGYDGAYKFATRLGLDKCYRIILPPGIKDVNEFFQKRYTLEQFQMLIKQSSHFHVQYVSSASEEIAKYEARLLSTDSEKEGLRLPWKKVDRLINGFGPGDLICLAGIPGVGKTCIALNLAYLFAKDNVPTLFFELEMRPQRIIPRLISLHMSMDTSEVNQVRIVQQAFKDFSMMPFLFAYRYQKPNFEFCADTIRKCYSRYGLKFVVFDNLHFLVRSVTDQTREVSNIVQSFKLLAEELSIPILLIARPRKMVHPIITNQDLKDSADIEGDSDTVILIHREMKAKPGAVYNQEEGIFVPSTTLRVSKARWGSGGDVRMITDDRRCKIVEDIL